VGSESKGGPKINASFGPFAETEIGYQFELSQLHLSRAAFSM
jgi:hypothetical protein